MTINIHALLEKNPITKKLLQPNMVINTYVLIII